MAARCATEAFSTPCTVHVEDCEGWWLPGCCSSVAEHKPRTLRLIIPTASFLPICLDGLQPSNTEESQ